MDNPSLYRLKRSSRTLAVSIADNVKPHPILEYCTASFFYQLQPIPIKYT